MGFINGISGLFLLLFSEIVSGHVCPTGWLEWSRGTSCYKITTATLSKSWTDARLSCRAYQGDLVVVNSVQEQAWLKSQLHLVSVVDPKTTKWWYGITNIVNENQWTWIDGSMVSNQITPWNTGEPNNLDGDEHCAHMTQSGMNDEDCTTGMAYVCERPKSVLLKCEIDNGWENYHGYCYKYFSDKNSWSEAQDVCDDQGGRLVNIFLDSIERYVTDLSNAKGNNAWIGLRSVPRGSTVSWIWTYSNYGLTGKKYWSNTTNASILPAEANSSCVEVTSGATDLKAWNKADCGQRKSFICEKPEGVCTDGWIQYQSKCYEIKTNLPLTWPQADAHCSAHAENGSLVEINSQLEQAFLNKYLGELSESNVPQVWIGISDNKRGDFTYSSGTQFGIFTNWVKNPSDNPKRLDCGQIFTGDNLGKWSITSNCYQLKAFICQVPTNVPIQDVTTPAPRVTCDPSWSLYANQCYQVNDTLMTWIDAKTNCQNVGGDLAKVSDNYTQAFITGQLSSALTWIGLNDQAKEGSFIWLDNTPVDFVNWYHGFPRSNGESNCVAMVNSADNIGQWKDMSCNGKYGFLCQKTPSINGLIPTTVTPTTPVLSARCGPNWEEDVSLGYCYSFQDSPLAWLDAYQWCQHNGGDLASIGSLQEQYFIIGRVRSMTSFAVWIGANARVEDDGWGWTDGSAFAYLNWKPGEPNKPAQEKCVNIVTKSGLWNNYRCDARNAFVCKKTNGVPPTIQYTTTKSSGSMGCQPGWKSFRNNCYFFKFQSVDRQTALSRCNQIGGNLASFSDASELNFVSSKLNGNGQYWIGLNDLKIEWTFEWSDGSPVTFTPWADSEPNNFENKDEDCVTMYAQDGKWNDNLCNFWASGYVCKSPMMPIQATTALPGCPPGSFINEGICYVVTDTKQTWQTAEDSCKSKGGHLATVTNSIVQAFISSEISGRSGFYWIGLSDTAKRGSYSWSSNASISFTFWGRQHTGKETDTCVALSTDKPVGLWLNDKCYLRHGTVCEVIQGGYTTIAPTPTQSTIQPLSCPDDWKEYNGFCYKAFSSYVKTSKMTRSEAAANCQGYGGNLVSILNKTEEDFIRQTVIKTYVSWSFWIGLAQRNLHEGYKWLDGKAFIYNNWGAEQPDNHNNMENCVIYDSKSNSWFDVNCMVANDWICKVKKGLVPPTTPVPPTAVSAPSCGESDWKYFQEMCYYVSVGNKKTWYQADSWCQQHGGHLASIAGHMENDLITSLTAKLSYGVYWIGLNNLDPGGYKWTDMTQTTFINWAKNEPNDGYGGQKCVNFYNFAGAWNDDNCGDFNEFICKKVNGSYSPLPTHTTTVRPGNCPKGFHGFKSKCFFLGGNTDVSKLSWTAAITKCRSFGTGYDIASIGSAEEQAFITSLLSGWKTSLWIGLNDKFNEGKFVWQDNTEVTFQNWAKGEPGHVYSFRQEDCVHLYYEDYHAGQWNDESCSTPLGYICEVYRSTLYPTQKPTALPPWCKPGYSIFGNNCFQILPEPVTWFNAKSRCKHDGSSLASISDVFEQSAIRVLTSSVEQPIWIGLHDAEVSGSYSWVDGWPVYYTNWAQGEPSKGVGEGCVSYLPSGMWNDTRCNQLFPAVCKSSTVTPPPLTTPRPGKCGDESWHKWGDYCYIVETSKASWADARFKCERKGMALASIHSLTEVDFVLKLGLTQRFTYGSKNLWIGLLKGLTSGFTWEDDSPVDYVVWGHGEPSDVNGTHHEDCVELHQDTGKWNDLPCKTLRGFVCKAPLILPTTTASAVTTPSQTSSRNVQPQTQASHTGSISNRPSRLPPISFPTRKGNSPPLTSNQGSSRLSAGGIVGICLGTLVVLALIAAVLIAVKRKRFVSKTNSQATGFDNALFSSSGDTVNIQSEFVDNSRNGHIHSSSA